MSPAILLTQCLQNDFIEPIGKDDAANPAQKDELEFYGLD